MKKSLLFLTCLISCNMSMAQSSWVNWDYWIFMAGGASFGKLECNGFETFSYGLYVNVMGLCVDASFGANGHPNGEHVYGPGSINDVPATDEFLFGICLPFYSYSKKGGGGCTVYLHPMMGYLYERYKYSDLYYGSSKRASYENYFSWGGIVSVAIKHKFLINAKYSRYGFNVGLGISLSGR